MTVTERADMGVEPGREAPLGARSRPDGRSPDGEEQSIARVITSLVAMFPAVPESDVRDCVERIRAGFATAPIRTYIPILVARQARAALLSSQPTAEGARVG
jgi:hypothetical protein